STAMPWSKACVPAAIARSFLCPRPRASPRWCTPSRSPATTSSASVPDPSPNGPPRCPLNWLLCRPVLAAEVSNDGRRENRTHPPPPPPLPPIRGRVQVNAPLAPFTWFRVGGDAEFLVRPADANDLASLLRSLPATTPVQVIGAASNLIIRDGGLPGVTIRLAR